MRALALLSLTTLVLAACDPPDPSDFSAKRADTATGSHINGVDSGDTQQSTDTHWIDYANRNTKAPH